MPMRMTIVHRQPERLLALRPWGCWLSGGQSKSSSRTPKGSPWAPPRCPPTRQRVFGSRWISRTWRQANTPFTFTNVQHVTLPRSSQRVHISIPTARKHGLQNPEGPHNGDMSNITVAADGPAKTTLTDARVTFGTDARSVFTGGGTALVIHAKGDDMTSDPAGNAGERIACGVIGK